MMGPGVKPQQTAITAGPSVSGRLLITFGLVSLALVTIAVLGAVAVGAQGPNQAGLVVDFGDDNVQTYCVSFAQDGISGMDLLLEASLVVETGFNGGAVCKINDVGCRGSDCWCQCPGSPCIYWIYWRLNEGNWEYSQEGATLTRLGNGDVDGWVWGEGAINAGGAEPPGIAFEDICVPPATNTPTSVPTATDAPTPAPTPTDTPQPTEEPELPTITHFTADRTTIYAGASVELRWDLHDASGAYLRIEGVEEGVVAPGSKTVTPATTTVYTLIARNDDGEVTAEVTITVNPATPTSVPADTPLPTDTPVPADIPTPAPSPPATDTPAPTQVPAPTSPPPLAPEATNTLPPPPTATWLPAITPTPTPVAMAAATSGLVITRQLTPGALVRETPAPREPAIPVIVLAVIGTISVIGGLSGVLVIAWTARQGQRRR